LVASAGLGGATGLGGTATFSGGNALSNNGGPVQLNGGNGVGTDRSSGGLTGSTGTSTGTGFANAKIQTSFTIATGSTTQTVGDRLFISGKTLGLSTTSATTTTILQLAVPTTNTGGGCTVFYSIEAFETTTPNVSVITGTFIVSAVNAGGTVTSSASATNTEQSQVTVGTLTSTSTTTITGTNVNVRMTPVWTVIVPTTVRVSYTVVPFGQGVTVTPS
jgi:hypothetical protein